jgi:hypothetical protein
MARECTVCAHPDVFTINERLVGIGGKSSNRSIAQQYGVGHGAVQRHREHVPQLLVKASEAMEIADADHLLDQVRNLQQRTLTILSKAEEGEDLRTALGAISQARGNLELLGKLAGELQQEGTVNIYMNPQWIELRAVIVNALATHPEAKRSVLRAIEEVNKNGS